MLDAIKSFFRSHGVDPEPASPAVSDRPLHIAACALLLELAHSDAEFTEDERRHVEEALVRHFGLPSETARELMVVADAQRRDSPDLHQFVSQITSSYDEGQRMVLVEVLWRVVYADGKLSKHEDYLMQKLARLLDLRPGYLAEARKRAQAGEDP